MLATLLLLVGRLVTSLRTAIDHITVYRLALEGIDLVGYPLTQRIAISRIGACVYIPCLKGMAPIDTPDVFPLMFIGMWEVEDVLPEPQLSILYAYLTRDKSSLSVNI
ncbi:hypothetical protein B0H14DRAFT_3458168 [Mycena olivaceomarginata]|nr:hypothetical protein B0H14DRAFT_3458168 [Mycena olivaceomarginata]